MLFAESDGFTLLILFAVLSFLGEGIMRLTNRMFALRERVRYWAIGLGIVTGILFFFMSFGGRFAPTPDNLLSNIFASGLVGACAGLVWYLAVAILTFLYQYIIAPPLRLLGRILNWPFARWSRGREERRWRLKQKDANRAAAERSRSAAKHVEAHATAQKRREDARAGCEVLFVTHSFDIRERFTREMFDAFGARHLGDDKSPEYVEKMARELSDIIRKHLQKAEPAVSVSELDAARKEVQACYDEHADLLREAFPRVRFRAELRVRITDTTIPQDAWKEARDMIHELLQLVAEEKQNQKNAAQANRKINPPVENI
jgi:hypothetical protein